MKFNRQKMAPWIGLIFGILISCLLAIFFKENPWQIFKILTTSSLNSKFDLGLTLFYTTCLIFSGLAFSIPLKAGLFHIGSEGQILISAFMAAYLGYALHLNLLLSTIVFIAGTLLTGIFSALIISAFKVFRGAHEVVVAIMLNFIFAALATWLTVNYVQNPESQNPETALIQPQLQFLKNDFLKNYFDQSPVSIFIIVAILTCIALQILENRSVFGYQLKAFGRNPAAAERLGLSRMKMIFIAMGLAGLFSACVSLNEVMGNSFQYKIGFSPQYGFIGIAVALLARQNSIGIIFSAFLMACLHKGASDLDLETQFLTRDFSKILQALIIFSVAASYFLVEKDFFKRKGKS